MKIACVAALDNLEKLLRMLGMCKFEKLNRSEDLMCSNASATVLDTANPWHYSPFLPYLDLGIQAHICLDR